MAQSFKEWYAKPENKKAISERRRKKYAEDSVYRQQVLHRSTISRALRNGGPTPEGYECCMAEAAEHLKITLWKLRWWRAQNYFPEPHIYKGMLWFNNNQLLLLKKLQVYIESVGARRSRSQQEDLDSVVSFIYANW